MDAVGLDLVLITIGAIFCLGLAGEAIGKKTRLPRVTILIVLGMILGPYGLGWLPPFNHAWFSFISVVALTMIGFLLGGKLSPRQMRQYGRPVLLYSLIITVGTFIIVAAGMTLVGAPVELALIFAGISLATDPIATLDVIEETRSTSTVGNLLGGIVALDDVWGLLLFAIMISAVNLFHADQIDLNSLLTGLWEIGGALVLGVALGVPVAFVTGRMDHGSPTLMEALAAVFLCAGLSITLHVSYLLASIVMGATVCRLARHHRQPFTEIEHIEWPFLVLFLILVGASFEWVALETIGLLGVTYLLSRVAGRVIGTHLVPERQLLSLRSKTRLGLCLLPQAGVALGAALYAASYMPEYRETIFSVTVAATVLFELIGPVIAKINLVAEQKLVKKESS